ncbi:MAG: biotin--[acetyl-CoA-carboxylase] ligase [Thermoplasmata archaeon]
MSWNIIRLDTVDSTNEVAKILVSEGVESRTVVVAQKQVEGRGRFGRSWSSPRGGLYVSIIVREELSRLPLITLAAGVAVVQALQAAGLKATIRWPNDVLIRDAKAAGILVEGLVGPEAYWAIVGIGINSDFSLEDLPPQLRHQTTTLRHELGHRVDNEDLLEGLLKAFQRVYPVTGEQAAVVDLCRQLCSTLGKNVVVDTGSGIIEGRAVDIGPSGYLVVETKTGKRMDVAEGSILEEG